MDKEFKSFLKLPGGGEIKRCFYPFKLDTYGRGCQHGCLYCYAKSVLSFRKLWDEKEVPTADFDKVKKLFDDVFNRGKKRKYSDLLKARILMKVVSYRSAGFKR
jgi:DNA repair photolyase